MIFDENLLEEFQDQLGYTFLNRNLLYQVLTTPAYSRENNNIDHNESLKPLGEAVLKLIITQHAIQILKLKKKSEITLFKKKHGTKEVITKCYIKYFGSSANSDVVLKLLKLGIGEISKEEYIENNFFGEILEALFGAIFLDTYCDLIRTETVVKRILVIK